MHISASYSFKKLSILIKLKFLLQDRLTSTLSRFFFHFSLSALPFDFDSFSLSFFFLLIFSSVACYLFLSACSLAIISVIILFTLPTPHVTFKQFESKRFRNKMHKKWKEFCQREYSHLIGLRLEEHVVLVEHVLVGICWGIGSIGNQKDWVHLKPKWSPRFVIDMTFVAIGQVTPPQKRTLDAPLLRIPSMNEIMWICLHPKTFPFHLVPLDLQV
jgi:hypothetical protein